MRVDDSLLALVLVAPHVRKELELSIDERAEDLVLRKEVLHAAVLLDASAIVGADLLHLRRKASGHRDHR